MKRYLKILLIVILVLPISIYAKKNSFNEVDITNINIGKNWKMVTTDNFEESINELGLDDTQKTSLKYNWFHDSYFAQLFSEDKTKEIIMMKNYTDSDFEDLSIYADEDINDYLKDVKKKYKNYKAKVTLYSTPKGIKYCRIEYKDEEASAYLIDYFTLIHGNMYQYKFQSNSEISTEDKNNLKIIIDSIEYKNYLKFIENNILYGKEKKSYGGVIAIVVVFLLIITGVLVYLFIFKKKSKNKNKNNYNTDRHLYNPVNQSSSMNSTVSNFNSSANSENRINTNTVSPDVTTYSNPTVSEFLNQSTNENKKNN